ncbi:hypothetical protein MMC07_000017 [Pseudocyphellaria aurata]|nr:hypothetical protein [Pseudocyphellaria aurata]
MSSQQPDENVPTKLPTESLGWNDLQTLKSQLLGRLKGLVLDRLRVDRPRRLDNDAAFFENDLRYILMAKPVNTQLSEERYKDMENMALRLLDVLNEIVNSDLIELREERDPLGPKLPEQSNSKTHDRFDNRYRRLNAMLSFLQARSIARFSLATGPEALFKLPPDGYGKFAKGHAKKWRAFLDSLSADAEIGQGQQSISLQAMGLPAEALSDDQLKNRASVVVRVMFKEFRQLDCADVRMHEIRLRLSGLYSSPPSPTLDMFVSCCQNEMSNIWHEAECGSFSATPDETGKQNLCTVIDQAINECKKLHLLVKKQELFNITGVMPKKPTSSANFTEESLMALFQRRLFSQITTEDSRQGLAENKVGLGEKAEIALMLARCLLDFFDDEIELASHSWVPEQILFITPSTHTVAKRGDVYISLRPRPCKVKRADLLQEFSIGNPVLLSFARLLLEIETGEKIPIEIHPETPRNIVVWGHLCKFVKDKKSKGESVQYLEAVEGCLYLCTNLPKSKHRVTGSAASQVLRKAIHEKIIRKLELVANPHSAKRKQQSSVSEHQQTKKPSNAPSPVRSSTMAKSKRETAIPGSPRQRLAPRPKLHDAPRPGMDSSRMSSHHRREEQSRILKEPTQQIQGRFDSQLCDSSTTNTYGAQPYTFKELNQTWNSRFEFKEGDEIVKIAILDTGIDLRHEDFQNMRAVAFHDGQPESAQGETSQIRRMPKKCQKNFCGNDEHDVQDRDGHGTQVASIILRLAPRAELCIARICDGDVNRGRSEGGKQEDTYIRYPRPETVVKAIFWAIEQKVMIINMSFGFDKADPEVEEALKLARRQKILVFAAMANEGRSA